MTTTPTHIRTGKVKAMLDAASVPYSLVKWSKDEECYWLEIWEPEHGAGLTVDEFDVLNMLHHAKFDYERDAWGIYRATFTDNRRLCLWVKFTLSRA